MLSLSAIVGVADYIMTGVEDLLVLKNVEGVGMVAAQEFWEILADESSLTHGKPTWQLAGASGTRMPR